MGRAAPAAGAAPPHRSPLPARPVEAGPGRGSPSGARAPPRPARGPPASGESDLKTTLARLILDRLGAGGSYTEYYALDFDEDFVLMGHDGPGHVAIAQQQPTLRALQAVVGVLALATTWGAWTGPRWSDAAATAYGFAAAAMVASPGTRPDTPGSRVPAGPMVGGNGRGQILGSGSGGGITVATKRRAPSSRSIAISAVTPASSPVCGSKTSSARSRPARPPTST